MPARQLTGLKARRRLRQNAAEPPFIDFLERYHMPDHNIVNRYCVSIDLHEDVLAQRAQMLYNKIESKLV